MKVSTKIKKRITEVLSPEFTWDSGRWIVRSEDVAVALELQKSNYSSEYYVNIGLQVGLESGVFPTHRMGASFRGSCFWSNVPPIDAGQMSDVDVEAFVSWISTVVKPFILFHCSLSGAAAMVTGYPGVVSKALEMKLGVKSK